MPITFHRDTKTLKAQSAPVHCPDDLQFRLSAIFDEAGTDRHEHVADHAAGPTVPSAPQP